MNINLSIRNGSKILRNKFISSSQLDSEILMAQTLKKDRRYVLLNSSNNLNKKELNHFYNLIEKRTLGNPIAYLTNKKFFWNYEFFINNGVLIPRPDTELIIENVLNLTKQKDKIRILDIGIGSGCILLSLLKESLNTPLDLNASSTNIPVTFD